MPDDPQPRFLLPPRPPALPAELQRRWNELVARHHELTKLDGCQLLELSEDASVADVRHAFARQVRRFHPDHLPTELAMLKPYAMRIIVSLNDARTELSTKAQRKTQAQVSARARAGGLRSDHRAPCLAEADVSDGTAAEQCEQAKGFARRGRPSNAAASMGRVRTLDDGPTDGGPLRPSEDDTQTFSMAEAPALSARAFRILRALWRCRIKSTERK